MMKEMLDKSLAVSSLRFKWVISALCLLFLFGCSGYHVAGKGGSLPGGIASISVPIFTNNTAKPGIESTLSPPFADELVKTGFVKVGSKSEGTLKGTIKEYTLRSISFDPQDKVKKYRLTVVIDLVLVESSTEKVLWEGSGFKDSEEFLAPADRISETNEDAALKKIATDLARLFKERVLEDF
jgi:hypothetical protein